MKGFMRDVEQWKREAPQTLAEEMALPIPGIASASPRMTIDSRQTGETMAGWCERHGIAAVHFAAVNFVFSGMTEGERAAQYNCMTAGWPGDQAAGWGKVKTMYDKKTGWRSEEVEIWGALLVEGGISE
jgi:hypothetical protein